MNQFNRPDLLGGMAAMLTVLLYPPICHSLALEWKMTGEPPNPCKRFIPGWLTAIYGDATRVERLRERAAHSHSRIRGELPPDVDAQRFGTHYRADDPVHMSASYVVFLHLMLAAQEALYRRLGEDERDRYCEQAARSVGYAFGVEDHVPITGYELGQEYDHIVRDRLQATKLARDAVRAMRESSRAYVMEASWLLDPRVVDGLGLAAHAGDADRHPIALEAMAAA